jgi:hypothetical protein
MNIEKSTERAISNQRAAHCSKVLENTVIPVPARLPSENAMGLEKLIVGSFAAIAI